MDMIHIQKNIVWHKIETEEDLPFTGLWLLCKVRGSHDLKLVCGFENVYFSLYDAYAIVDVPYFKEDK